MHVVLKAALHFIHCGTGYGICLTDGWQQFFYAVRIHSLPRLDGACSETAGVSSPFFPRSPPRTDISLPPNTGLAVSVCPRYRYGRRATKPWDKPDAAGIPSLMSVSVGLEPSFNPMVRAQALAHTIARMAMGPGGGGPVPPMGARPPFGGPRWPHGGPPMGRGMGFRGGRGSGYGGYHDAPMDDYDGDYDNSYRGRRGGGFGGRGSGGYGGRGGYDDSGYRGGRGGRGGNRWGGDDGGGYNKRSRSPSGGNRGGYKVRYSIHQFIGHVMW